MPFSPPPPLPLPHSLALPSHSLALSSHLISPYRTFNHATHTPSYIVIDCLEGGYKPVFTNRLQLEEALLFCKTTLENNLKENVNLVRVSAPVFVSRASGFNDNLNGTERPATFEPRDFPGVHLEVPFSLAKWKRWALHY